MLLTYIKIVLQGQMARIASLYIPWLGIVIENIGRLDYRKRIVNKILKRPIDSSLQRYYTMIIPVYLYCITTSP